MTITAERLKEIRERCDKATPGQWAIMPDLAEIFHGCDVIVSEHIDDAIIGTIGGDVAEASENGAFIASARTDIPDLLDEFEQLRAESQTFPPVGVYPLNGVRVLVRFKPEYVQKEEREGDGWRFGRYLHNLKEWRVEGSNSPFNDWIECWRPLPSGPTADR